MPRGMIDPIFVVLKREITELLGTTSAGWSLSALRLAERRQDHPEHRRNQKIAKKDTATNRAIVRQGMCRCGR